MKINFLNSLLFLTGLFVIGIIIDKLFGEISAGYAVLIFGAGYLLGDTLGFDRGEKVGDREASTRIEKLFEQKHK
jgi:hypothetical protein